MYGWKNPCSSVFFIIMSHVVKREEKKKTEWKLYVWILNSEVFIQCRLLVCQTMLTLLQFLPNYAFQILKEPSGKTECLCYIPHEQILLRRWSRLYPNPGLRQMLPHLWGSNSLNVLLPAVSGDGGRRADKWLIFDIMQCLSLNSDYWNLPSYTTTIKDCVCVHVCACVCVCLPILQGSHLLVFFFFCLSGKTQWC